MKRSRERILTTHTGSLPRPTDLVEMVQAKETGGTYDAAALAERTSMTAICNRRQVLNAVEFTHLVGANNGALLAAA